MSPGGPGTTGQGMASLTAVRPQNLFGPVPGLTGLAETWYVARPVPGAYRAKERSVYVLG